MPNNNISLEEFAANTRKMGVDITGYNPNDKLYLFNVAKLCAKTAGVSMGAVGGLFGTTMGSVTVPVIGSVPGFVAGFLAGAIGGTVSCTIARMSMKRDLDQFLNDSSTDVKGKVIHDL